MRTKKENWEGGEKGRDRCRERDEERRGEERSSTVVH